MLKGSKHSEETKRKMSLAKIGHEVSLETRLKISMSETGKIVSSPSLETRKKISMAHKGRKAPWLIGKKQSIETIAKRKRTILENNDGHFANWKGGISKDLKHYARVRRARENNAPGYHSSADWMNLKIFYKFMCLCCKKTEPEIKLTEDHIVPLSKGGSDNIENIQPLCRSCNSMKHASIMNFRTSML